jgi:hypothetical protein
MDVLRCEGELRHRTNIRICEANVEPRVDSPKLDNDDGCRGAWKGQRDV